MQQALNRKHIFASSIAAMIGTHAHAWLSYNLDGWDRSPPTAINDFCISIFRFYPIDFVHIAYVCILALMGFLLAYRSLRHWRIVFCMLFGLMLAMRFHFGNTQRDDIDKFFAFAFILILVKSFISKDDWRSAALKFSVLLLMSAVSVSVLVWYLNSLLYSNMYFPAPALHQILLPNFALSYPNWNRVLIDMLTLIGSVSTILSILFLKPEFILRAYLILFVFCAISILASHGFTPDFELIGISCRTQIILMHVPLIIFISVFCTDVNVRPFAVPVYKGY